MVVVRHSNYETLYAPIRTLNHFLWAEEITSAAEYPILYSGKLHLTLLEVRPHVVGTLQFNLEVRDYTAPTDAGTSIFSTTQTLTDQSELYSEFAYSTIPPHSWIHLVITSANITTLHLPLVFRID